MEITGLAKKVCDELYGTLGQINSTETDKLICMVCSANRIFVAGAGRSGLFVRAFAMRLMHLGFTTYVVGEIVTPAIKEGDLLLIASGSGETGSLVSMADKAKSHGVDVALVSIFVDSTIGKIADVVVEIPAPTPKAKKASKVTSIQPMGSLFEQSMLLFFECLVMMIMNKIGKDSDAMFTLHANLE
jgi:6-phospho-3-hexuloisomerase